MSDIPAWGEASTRPRCAACHKVMVINFAVPNEMWEAVVHPSLRNSYLCIQCFASRADEKMIEWDLPRIQLEPISLVGHLRRCRNLGLAERKQPLPILSTGGSQ